MCLCLICCSAPAPTVASVDDTLIDPHPPADIPGGAPAAGLSAAARFAWDLFIALNWRALPQTGAPGTRGTADAAQPFGDPGHPGPLVWETFRSKSEVFPGSGDPHGRAQGKRRDYGYDEPPRYVFDPARVGRYPGRAQGEVPACTPPSSAPGGIPWINLSEAHEAGPVRMYAGIAPRADDLGQRILYTVKSNRTQYRYIAANGWYDGGRPGSTIPHAATREYIAERFADPPPGSTRYVSFPEGTIEIKAAWRQLTPAEMASGRFHSARVRYYRWQDPARTYAGIPGNPDHPCHLDGDWGLIGMHIIIKTPSAPYFVWSTFEQADNLLDPAGKPVEHVDGSAVGTPAPHPTDPPIESVNATSADPATPASIQKLRPAVADSKPGKRLYYRNAAGTPTPQGTVSVNRRVHAVPRPVVDANRKAQAAIGAYARSQGISTTPWAFYKLISVQWRPADKPVPGTDWAGDPDAANEVLRYPTVYYQANLTMETSHRLQLWSGRAQHRLPRPYAQTRVDDLISDFRLDGTPVKNVQYDARRPDGRTAGYNMGGCMGCHGQMQAMGYGFSFVFRRGRVEAPEVDRFDRPSLREMMSPRTRRAE